MVGTQAVWGDIYKYIIEWMYLEHFRFKYKKESNFFNIVQETNSLVIHMLTFEPSLSKPYKGLLLVGYINIQTTLYSSLLNNLFVF